MTSTHLKKSSPSNYAYKVMEKPTSVLRAVIFDCDGVLIDSEELHMSSFKKALGELGEKLSEEEYTERYLSLDDKGAFTKFYTENKLPLEEKTLADLIVSKNKIYKDLVKSEGVLAYPAVPEFVMAVSQKYPLAVASGSRKDELDLVLEAAGILSYFDVIVSADDVEQGKPNPESYLKAVEELNKKGDRPTPIQPNECLVIEDSKECIKSAHAVGMKCIGVANSFPSFELSHADLVVPSLTALHVAQLEDLFQSHKTAPKPISSPQNN